MCDQCLEKSADSITLANGVFVPAPVRREAVQKIVDLVQYATDVLKETATQESGIVWDLSGYCHGHIEEIPEAYHAALQSFGIMEEDGTIPPEMQWALVSLCCKGERLGRYAWKKAKY